jgi:steroid 5-alpha reductase family enzyme
LVSSEIAGELDSLLPNILLLFGLALIISSIGFYRVVYFISIGYAFSMVAMALATVLLMGRELPWTSLPQKVLIWISVSALYVLMFSPSLMSLTSASLVSPTLTSIVQSLGLLLMAGGLFLEALADKQKSDFKARFPTQFCDVGLYRWVRCPNYLGEIVYWAGNWVVGLLFYASLVRWAASSIGLVCIVLIMMGSTKRLERAQGERYGDLPGYQEYIRSVPVLFPFVPIYTLKNVRVFLE